MTFREIVKNLKGVVSACLFCKKAGCTLEQLKELVSEVSEDERIFYVVVDALNHDRSSVVNDFTRLGYSLVQTVKILSSVLLWEDFLIIDSLVETELYSTEEIVKTCCAAELNPSVCGAYFNHYKHDEFEEVATRLIQEAMDRLAKLD